MSLSQDNEHPAWEKTIVTTLRDLQWLYKRVGDAAPGGFLSFDWAAEQALGDAAVDANNRFYLLELKSSGETRSNDWRPSKVKKTYEGFEKRFLEFKGEPAGEIGAWLLASVRCHLFAYWLDDEPFDDARRRHGQIVFSPYFRDLLCLSPLGQSAHAASAHDFLRRVALGVKGVGDRSKQYEHLLANRLFDGSAIVRVRTKEEGGELKARELPCGLNSAKFQGYIDWFLKSLGKGDHDLRMVLMSSTGGVLRYLAKSSQLAAVMQELRNASVAPASASESSVERTVEWNWDLSPPPSSRRRRGMLPKPPVSEA